MRDRLGALSQDRPGNPDHAAPRRVERVAWTSRAHPTGDPTSWRPRTLPWEMVSRWTHSPSILAGSQRLTPDSRRFGEPPLRYCDPAIGDFDARRGCDGLQTTPPCLASRVLNPAMVALSSLTTSGSAATSFHATSFGSVARQVAATNRMKRRSARIPIATRTLRPSAHRM